mmetsp:Transcript_469/g.1337  ORF Transcript_469/g.1337 Transcript_469/m.1337 type:complete len:196 (-) Transcript_469:492-1079(-)
MASESLSAQDWSDLKEKVNDRSQLQALVAALFLTITYALDGTPTDIHDFALCSEAEGDALCTCSNVHGSCGRSEDMLAAYRVLNYVASMSYIVVLGMIFTILSNFAKADKVWVARYFEQVGWVVDGMDKVMYAGCAFWLAGFTVQMSLNLSPGEFWICVAFEAAAFVITVSVKIWMRWTRMSMNKIAKAGDYHHA